jgi:NADPH-dependent glutamate synthase beta subunit-like oxidoreductase/Pyruvate/2-oxoacid:ferredoxin oxidoreductase delta subunit
MRRDELSKGALIIGGSAAGIQAAFDLANSGIAVHLLEPAPFLDGGTAAGSDAPPQLVSARLLELAKHANVTTWTGTRVVKAEGGAGRWRLELAQHPRYVDLAKCTACGDCVEVCPVTVPGTGRKAIYLQPGSQLGCAAIDKEGRAPCSAACPGGIHVQGYVALTAQGRFQEAIDLIREAIPFPGICGRICTHPCEINCRRAELEQAVAIRPLKRFLADWELQEGRAQEPAATSAPGDDAGRGAREAALNQRVAVVGAGPAGMTVADRLARQGYGVTVFDRLPVIGGMMAVGIPEYRLPRDVIAREYQRIRELGIELRLNTAIGAGAGSDYGLDDLLASGYDAVCLAIGAHRSHSLRIPGEELPGVVHGIELLKIISLSQQLDRGTHRADLEAILRRGAETRVAVLGGGNTAMDVSRSLRRLGVRDVRILYRRTRAEMPAMPEEIHDAEEEGVSIEYLMAPTRVLGDRQTGVVGLECQRMELGEPDASGRRRPVPIPGSEHVVDLDLVVLAIGQAPDLEGLGAGHGLSVNRAERIALANGGFATNRPGVFAAGDAVTQDKMAVIEAIGMGKKAAAEIDAYLRGVQAATARPASEELPIAHRELSEEERRPSPRLAVPLIPMEQRLASYAEVETGFTAQQAVAEAQRCLACGPCSECLACVHACKPGAIVHEQAPRSIGLEVGAIIYAAGPAAFELLPLAEGPGCYHAAPESRLRGSAAAARAMVDLFGQRQAPSIQGATAQGHMAGGERTGVFVCQCGGEISDTVDTDALRERATAWPGVVHSQVLPFSCSPEAAETIAAQVEAYGLDRVVLAACSCCAIDQVCYSCTYQRVRCKDNLGIFAQIPGTATYEFVNIREQCAWVHPGDPQAATAKATALVAAAVARSALPHRAAADLPLAEKSALVLGNGAAAAACRQALEGQGIAVKAMPAPGPGGYQQGPALEVRRSGGRYVASCDGMSGQGVAVVLAPGNGEELEFLLSACSAGQVGLRPRIDAGGGGVETHRPGILVCDPQGEAEVTGAAAAARAAAWLGSAAARPRPTAAVVDAARCRACATCVAVCEFGAPQLVGQDPRRTSWIDPAICTGCGTCVAHCPSGAISGGYSSEAQIAAMLEQLLAGSGRPGGERRAEC